MCVGQEIGPVGVTFVFRFERKSTNSFLTSRRMLCCCIGEKFENFLNRVLNPYFEHLIEVPRFLTWSLSFRRDCLSHLMGPFPIK